ncbi:MAG: hypothetical protein O7F16_03070 [Acidobacteria bacterium]|nr:hypothetical protein [Acidobacteriota bacterium]
MECSPSLIPFPTLAVKVRELKRMLASSAPSAKFQAQLRLIRQEHRRRMGRALRTLRALKPQCSPDLQPLWRDTLDSAILLLHLNARDYREVLHDLSGTRRSAGG